MVKDGVYFFVFFVLKSLIFFIIKELLDGFLKFVLYYLGDGNVIGYLVEVLLEICNIWF